eukprot:g9532.t1
MTPAARTMRAAALLSMVVYHVAAQETCTSVTVTGGDFPGVYEQGTGDSSGSFLRTADGSTQVLQAVAFGATRARRNLGESGSGRRGLADDCSTQIWVLTDSSAVADEGFPYYTTFDCADHPASVESTWLLVDCETCSEVAPISVVCTAEVGADDGALGTGDGDGGGALALPAIIGIAAGGLVLLLCLGFCFSRRKKQAHKGSHTFADDSEHGMAQQKNVSSRGAAVAGPTDYASASASANGSRGPLPAYSDAVGETVESPLGAGATAGAGSGSLGLIAKGANAKSFKPNSGPNNPAFEGIFATRGSGGGGGGGGNSSQGGNSASTMAHPPAVEMRSKFGNPEMMRKDSMAAAAAAAAASASAASRSQGGSGMHDVDMNSPRGFGNVLSSGVVEGRSRGTPPQQQQRPPPRAARGTGLEGGGDGGGITWSAGQNLNHHRRGGYPASDFGGDSAAGSVYELQPPDDDEDLEHTYHDDGCVDSVAASSPGAYSMYSHYTAGGGTYGGGGAGDTWSSDEGSGLRPDDRVGGGGVGGGGVGGGGGGSGTIPSPATLGARNGLGGTPPSGAEGAGSSRR